MTINSKENSMTLDQMFDALRSKGVAEVVVHYSGGNDEGGADGIDVFDAAGAAVTLPPSGAHEDTRYENGKRVPMGWVVTDWNVRPPVQRPATDEETLWAGVHKQLEAPIYDRYKSFAGEFECYGTVTWDITTGEYEMDDHYRYMMWD